MRRRRDTLRASAPKEWEGSATSVARLYRRLVVAVDAADTAVRDLRKGHVTADRLEEAAAGLRAHAVSLTAHLVVASRLPLAKRQRALRPIRSQVDDVEWLSARIGTSAIEARGYGTVDAGLADIAERLAALELSRSLLEDEHVEKRRSRLHRRTEDRESGTIPAPFRRRQRRKR
jgi:hypothetical protein